MKWKPQFLDNYKELKIMKNEREDEKWNKNQIYFLKVLKFKEIAVFNRLKVNIIMLCRFHF